MKFNVHFVIMYFLIYLSAIVTASMSGYELALFYCIGALNGYFLGYYPILVRKKSVES